MSVLVLPSALVTVDSNNTDPNILCPFGAASAYHNKVDLCPWAPWVLRHLSQVVGLADSVDSVDCATDPLAMLEDPTMGLERLYLVHQPVDC